ncbi:unnamed protein product [Brassica rapa]|uniref:Uncharacterized protein n=2 Tax=Brassica TaxID=3705 RepID=A0A8D9GR94_BRACM|nr:unnamed protein product [Brassica napus]CAG7885510.1 unnamed protein product [Brassica rapa]
MRQRKWMCEMKRSKLEMEDRKRCKKNTKRSKRHKVFGELHHELKGVKEKKQKKNVQEFSPLVWDHTTVLKKLEYWRKHKFRQKCRKHRDVIVLICCSWHLREG